MHDKWLVLKFNQGSPDALEAIYEKYKVGLLSLAFSLLGDIHSAEDVLHDTFVSFAGTAGSFRLTGSLKGYLSVCVVNHVRDIFRKSSRRETDLETTEDVLVSEISPEIQAQENEKVRELKRLLDQLPFEQRAVIVMHLHHGMKFRSIASQQNVSISTINSRYRYGLKKLRDLVNGELEI